MFVGNLLNNVISFTSFNSRADDDFADRLSHRYTVGFLIVFSGIVSTTQYVGNPIQCWCPAIFTSSHQEFTNKICWIKNTYYLPLHAIAGSNYQFKLNIGYYQWIPIFLLIQCVMFYLPCYIWRKTADHSGINIPNLIEAAESIQNALYRERRDKTIEYVIRHIDHFLIYQHKHESKCGFTLCKILFKHSIIFHKKNGNYLISIYICSKLIYIVNSIFQYTLMCTFLGTTNIHIMTRLYKLTLQNDYEDIEPIFPLQTLCDFYIRQMGTLQKHTYVNCILRQEIKCFTYLKLLK
ncbi:hypothetical protein A3Q56_02698 [Intoshia linei]|uniref:Innexin n=1 Tax=Intoshia linei TaxID=1819745 RepID=A0A177B5P7_9BILA|nr:hypothetical protein A3Q56_02698 [Intoshia linei]